MSCNNRPYGSDPSLPQLNNLAHNILPRSKSKDDLPFHNKLVYPRQRAQCRKLEVKTTSNILIPTPPRVEAWDGLLEHSSHDEICDQDKGSAQSVT